MPVTITLREQGCDPKEVQVHRIPCAYEWIEVAGTEYQATSVKHIANGASGDVWAVVEVMRARDAT